MSHFAVITCKIKYSIFTFIIIIISSSRLPFQPIAIETLGPINESASESNFFSVLAKKISHHSGDERETAFFVPARFRASTAIQRRAATRFICVWGLPGVVTPIIFFYFFQTPQDPWYRGYKIIIIKFIYWCQFNVKGTAAFMQFIRYDSAVLQKRPQTEHCYGQHRANRSRHAVQQQQRNGRRRTCSFWPLPASDDQHCVSQKIDGGTFILRPIEDNASTGAFLTCNIGDKVATRSRRS